MNSMLGVVAVGLSIVLCASPLAALPLIKGSKKETPPKWEKATTVKLKAEDMLGLWYGITVEAGYYLVWEIEYLKGGKFRLTTFERNFTEEIGKHEDVEETTTGTWKIREDGIFIMDEGERGEGEDGIAESWLKPIKRTKDKVDYLLVFPHDEEPEVTVIHEYRGKAPAVLKDLAPALSSPFKKKE